MRGVPNMSGGRGHGIVQFTTQNRDGQITTWEEDYDPTKPYVLSGFGTSCIRISSNDGPSNVTASNVSARGTELRRREVSAVEKKKDAQKVDAFIDAAREGNCEAIKQFLREGGDINAKGWTENTAVYTAAAHEKENVLELLLAHEANPHEVCFAKKLPLHIAVIRNSKKNMQMLIEKSTPEHLNALDYQEKTVLDWALENNAKNQEIIDLLRSRGGKTAKELRQERGEPEPVYTAGTDIEKTI